MVVLSTSAVKSKQVLLWPDCTPCRSFWRLNGAIACKNAFVTTGLSCTTACISPHRQIKSRRRTPEPKNINTEEIQFMCFTHAMPQAVSRSYDDPKSAAKCVRTQVEAFKTRETLNSVKNNNHIGASKLVYATPT